MKIQIFGDGVNTAETSIVVICDWITEEKVEILVTSDADKVELR